jgi:hypothetical protein
MYMVFVIGTMVAVLCVLWSARRSYNADMRVAGRTRAALPGTPLPREPGPTDDGLRNGPSSEIRTELPFS